MFDYQAGEKYKLTLIMVGFAGLMAGMLFTMLVMPQPDPRAMKARKAPAWTKDPDAGYGRAPRAYNTPQDGQPATAAGVPPQAGQQPQAQYELADPNMALNLVSSWLPVVWDLSAATAQDSQEKAIAYMTPECATAYRQSIWTPDTAKQVVESGLQSSFNAKKVSAGQNQADGSVVIYVEGEQILQVAGKPARARPVKMEYLVKKLPEGYRISGITETPGAGG
ncbi:MAG TPA: hypothetical protein V6C89_04455 [Drouetiella sp.]|jgi:hypothetical protein